MMISQSKDFQKPQGIRLVCSKQLSIMLLSSALNIIYYPFKKKNAKIAPQILAKNVRL